MFCGRNFCADRNSLNYTATYLNDIQKIVIQNGEFDVLHVTKNVLTPYTTYIPKSVKEWDYETILLAFFDDNLIGGNIDYSLDQVSSIRIKVKPHDSYDWITVYDVPITKLDDFKFNRFYKYCRSEELYDFSFVPVVGTIEGNYNTNSVYSKFDSLFVVDKSLTYSTLLESSISLQRNRPSTIVSTISKKYPYVLNIGSNNYYSGSVSTEFLCQASEKVDSENINNILKNSWKYRKDLSEFLNNGSAKILKAHDGRMWMISVVETPTDSNGSHRYLPATTFEWIEIGDCLSSNDLYNNNLIDVNVEGS